MAQSTPVRSGGRCGPNRSISAEATVEDSIHTHVVHAQAGHIEQRLWRVRCGHDAYFHTMKVIFISITLRETRAVVHPLRGHELATPRRSPARLAVNGTRTSLGL